jgi:hypothetical protein
MMLEKYQPQNRSQAFREFISKRGKVVIIAIDYTNSLAAKLKKKRCRNRDRFTGRNVDTWIGKGIARPVHKQSGHTLFKRKPIGEQVEETSRNNW